MTRAIPKLQPSLFDEIVIDNFAGGGGASLGMEWGLGRAVDIAINHDREAVSMHEANHPWTTHYCEDVWTVDPVSACKGRTVGLAWFSPDCKHFSKAKGGKPVSRKIRGFAWIVVKWAKKVTPRVIMLENVEEFQDWGPLVQSCDSDGKPRFDSEGRPLMMPCGVNKGKTFYLWVHRLEQLGYEVDWREIRACDYGAPTIRKRLFLIARHDGLPIVWPKPTHGDPKSEEVKSGKLKPWKTAANCIDWSIPCFSIFLNKEEARTVGVKRPLAAATMRRIAKGVMRYVVESPDPFVVTYYGDKGGEFRGQSIHGPLATQTTSNRHSLVVPVFTEHANASSPRCMPADEPLRTICANVKGGHHALVSAFLAKHYTGVVGSDVRDPIGTVTAVDHHSLVSAHIQRDFSNSIGHAVDTPIGTVTAGGGGKAGLVTSHLVKLRGTCRDGQPVTAPMPTLTASGQHVGEVRAFLLKYYGSDQDPQLLDPMHTVTTKDRFGLVTVHGEIYHIADICLRMLSPRELFRAQGFPDDYIIDIKINGKNLTKEAQVRMCGNSVSPYVPAALVSANVQIGKQKRVSRREVHRLHRENSGWF